MTTQDGLGLHSLLKKIRLLEFSLNFVKEFKMKKVWIISIRSDYGGKFGKENFHLFCEENDILPNFSTPKTPQQNRVVERKNRSLQDMVKTMLNDNSTPKHL